MAEEIGFENGRNSNLQGLVTLTLTLDPAIRHTVVHHSSTSTYIPNFIEIGRKFFSNVTTTNVTAPNFIQIEETLCGRTDVRTYGRTDIFPPLILLGRLLEVDLKRIASVCPSPTPNSTETQAHTYFGHLRSFGNGHRHIKTFQTRKIP